MASVMDFYSCRQTRARSEGLNSPAGPLAKRLKECRAIGFLGGGADPIVEKLGVLADENAPFLRLHTVEDDAGRLGGGRRGAFAETSFHFRHPFPDPIVGPTRDVDP